MKRNLVKAPANKIVTLSEAKAHLRVTDTDEDDLIETFIGGACNLVEQKTNRSYVPRSYRVDMSGFQDSVDLYGVPLNEITSVQYYDSDNALQTVTSTDYSISQTDGKLIFNSDYSFPSVYGRHDAVQITYVAGYDMLSIPDAAKAAVLLIVGDMFENREAQIIGLNVMQNMTVASLISSLKAHSL